MPAHNRLRPNDRHRIEHTRYEPVEPCEDKAVEPAEGRALMATPTQQYIQLMTKRSTSASSDFLDRKRSTTIHLSRFRSSNTRSSWPDSDPHAKRTEFATDGILGSLVGRLAGLVAALQVDD